MPAVESTPEMAAKVYESMERTLQIVRRRLGRPLTLADKVLLGHLDDPEHQEMEPGVSYLFTRPDRVVLQDEDPGTAGGQEERGGQAVDPRAHHDRVPRSRRHASVLALEDHRDGPSPLISG